MGCSGGPPESGASRSAGRFARGSASAYFRMESMAFTMSFRALPPALAAYFALLCALTGACLGSFINCWALRCVSGQRFPRGRSRCPRCGHTLGVFDLIPLVSWLCLRGRCRYCGGPVSPRYPVTEALSALALLAVGVTRGLTLRALELALMLPPLLLLALVDWDTMELPNGPMLLLAGLFLLFLPAHPAPLTRLWQGAAAGAAVFALMLALSLVMDKLLGRESLGGGDLKLMAVLALFTGPAGVVLMLLAASVLGLCTMALLRARGRAFPFGPALCAAGFLTALWGQPVLSWYLSLFR